MKRMKMGSALFALVVFASEAVAQEWDVYDQVDSKSGIRWVMIAMPNQSREELRRDPLSFGLLRFSCAGEHGPGVDVIFPGTVDVGETVIYGFDDGAPVTETWDIGENGKLVSATNPQSFLAKAKIARSVNIRVVREDDSIVARVFSLMGLTALSDSLYCFNENPREAGELEQQGR